MRAGGAPQRCGGFSDEGRSVSGWKSLNIRIKSDSGRMGQGGDAEQGSKNNLAERGEVFPGAGLRTEGKAFSHRWR